jgi:hypothetical protein
MLFLNKKIGQWIIPNMSIILLTYHHPKLLVAFMLSDARIVQIHEQKYRE